MGLLTDYLTKTIPQNARNLWGDVKQLPSALAAVGTKDFWQTGMFDPAKVQQAMRSQGRITPQDANKMAAVGMDFVQPMGGLLGHIVYHGSPHKFSKFDMSKIGTGEGAQAYGHGLYFAESPEVARSYRNALSDTLEVKAKDVAPLEKRAGQMALTFGDNTTEGALKWLEKFKGKGAGHTSPAMTPELVDSVIARFQKGDFYPGGAFYKVDIPDEAIPRMLDWDKPLSEQSEVIQNLAFKAAKPLKKEVNVFSKNPINGDLAPQNIYDLTGAELQRVLANSDEFLGISPGSRLSGKPGWTQELVMQKMKDMGIPGIRYLDGMSRGAGQGSSNYVLFDDQLPRILEINGQPTGLKPWGPDEWKGLLR